MSVDWPPGFARTEDSSRRRTSQYQVPLSDAVSDLEVELDRLDPSTWTVSFGNTHSKSNGMPLYNANPDDPGFVVRWMMDGENFAVACDHYKNLRDNVREVGLWIHETRMRGGRDVETGDVAFAAARLPPAGEDQSKIALSDGDMEDAAHRILGVPEGADEGEIRDAYREKLKETHPDKGGSMTALRRVKEAKEVLL